MKQKQLLLVILILVIFVFSSFSTAMAAGERSGSGGSEKFVCFNPTSETVALSADNIILDRREHSCVRHAAENLQKDFLRVTGRKPTLNNLSDKTADGTIVVGTVGSSTAIDKLVAQGELNDLKGRKEKYIIKTIGAQLVIAGSDKRGTVYGIYELSRQIGVSPWYYWADVPTAHHEQIYIKKGEYTEGEPRVRYRGIFLNDEAPCLTSWVKNTFGTEYGDHRFYEHVFELILRLKGNLLWPAMWGWAFYADDPENSKLADEMGIIIGTSHHEPMARNHQEWARHRKEYGAWNYQTNQAVIDRFFTEGIKRMKGTDDLVTIGMRGDGDEAMSEEADTRLLGRIIKNQRKIISRITGRPAKETPQVWALYKEVLDYYDKGMRVPDDVLILLCDDNWGNLRRVPPHKGQQKDSHPGGWGLYYHVDYVGAPRNSKWLNVTPTQNMWEQLTLAADYGLDRMWILNVGDLKPMEYPIQVFMDMAWNPGSVSKDVVESHTEPFCNAIFGTEQGPEAARILDLQGRYAGRTTAEMMDRNTYNVETGEWRRVADDYMRLETEALRQYITLEPALRDAYQQLILFPVQAMSNIYQMYYAQAMNHWLAARQLPEANKWAARVKECFRRDSLLCSDYNNKMAGGKWRGMMTQKHIGYTIWNDDFPADRLPETKSVAEREGGYSFEMAEKGYLSIEAEHYFTAETTGSRETSTQGDKAVRWTVIPGLGRTLSGVTLMPYTEPTDGATLNYRFSAPKTDSLTIHIVVKSTLDYLNKGGLTYIVSLDGGTPQRVNFNSRLNEKKENIYNIFYPTVARRVVESIVKLPVEQKETHTLTLHPEDPAIVFEKIVIDAGGYKPQFLFGEE